MGAKDEAAGVFTSDQTIRMNDSICRAQDWTKVKTVTATALTQYGDDGPSVLLELWGEHGVVVSQYLADDALSKKLLKKIGKTGRRKPIL